MKSLWVPLSLFGGGLLLLLSLGALAWLYEKTRRRIHHDQLGDLTAYGHDWTGLRVHIHSGEPALRFRLPGDKQGPSPATVAQFEQLWSHLEDILERIRPAAWSEYEQIRECLDSPEDRKLVGEIDSDFSRHWWLREIALLRGSQKRLYWSLDFEVAWDPEHSRTAYLDLEEKLLHYDLSCAVIDPWQ